MNDVTVINVPRGIRYLSDWSDFKLPETPTIIDKQITGCGFTEFAIRCPYPVIQVSPRLILLENKAEKHPGEIFYARNKNVFELAVDKDLNAKIPKFNEVCSCSDNALDLENEVKQEYIKFVHRGQVPKFCCTYDSFRHVRTALDDLGVMNQFYVVVDEFQSIFMDARFKAGTEIEFVYYLQEINKLCFVSATPMLDEYLQLIPEFSNLPYLVLDWGKEDPSRIVSPNINPIPYSGSLVSVAKNLIDDFNNGIYDKDIKVEPDGTIIETEARELVFYVNSVKNICDIIKKCDLTFDNTNVICADTPDNRDKLAKAYGITKKEMKANPSKFPKGCIGKVPIPDPVTGVVVNKPITLCTKTVYYGADFLSKCAKTIILSDGTIECLAVDITLDIPQIIGRQRLEENPWKNSADIYFKPGLGAKEVTEEDFMNLVNRKLKRTENLLLSYTSTPSQAKQDLAITFHKEASRDNYKDNYVSVNQHAGSELVPCKNELVLIAERRAFDIQKKDYASRFSVFNSLANLAGESIKSSIIDGEIIGTFIDNLNNKEFISGFPQKMEYIISTIEGYPYLEGRILSIIPKQYKNYLVSLGKETIRRYSCRKSELENEYQRRFGNQGKLDVLSQSIYSTFKEGSRYTKAELKETIRSIYETLDVKRAAKANDIEQWFEIKPCKLTINGKRDNSFELIKKKLL